MTRYVTALALAAFMFGPGLSTAMAAGSTGNVVAQSSSKTEDCSKITNAKQRAECLKEQQKKQTK